MNTTEIVLPDGTLLHVDRIRKTANWVVVRMDTEGNYDVVSAHASREAGEKEKRRRLRIPFNRSRFAVIAIPGRDETGTSGYEQVTP